MRIKKIYRLAKANYLFLFFLVAGFVVAISLFKIIASKPTFVYAKVKMSQGLWWASTLKPAIWLSKSLKKGETEYSLLGKPTAQILAVRYYPSDLKNQYEVYLTLKLSADFNKRTNKYLFKRTSIAVGSPVEFEFPTSYVTGTVIDISQKEFEDNYVEKIIELRKAAAEPWEFEAIEIGDKYFDGERYVFEVLDKQLLGLTASFYKDVRGLVLPSTLEKQAILVKAKIKVKQKNNQFVFAEEQVVNVGKTLLVQTTNFFFDDFFVAAIE